MVNTKKRKKDACSISLPISSVPNYTGLIIDHSVKINNRDILKGKESYIIKYIEFNLIHQNISIFGTK